MIATVTKKPAKSKSVTKKPTAPRLRMPGRDKSFGAMDGGTHFELPHPKGEPYEVIVHIQGCPEWMVTESQFLFGSFDDDQDAYDFAEWMATLDLPSISRRECVRRAHRYLASMLNHWLGYVGDAGVRQLGERAIALHRRAERGAKVTTAAWQDVYAACKAVHGGIDDTTRLWEIRSDGGYDAAFAEGVARSCSLSTEHSFLVSSAVNPFPGSKDEEPRFFGPWLLAFKDAITARLGSALPARLKPEPEFIHNIVNAAPGRLSKRDVEEARERTEVFHRS